MIRRILASALIVGSLSLDAVVSNAWTGAQNNSVQAASQQVQIHEYREAAKVPWSGNWWPANGSAPSLIAENGPLHKYDYFVEVLTGVNPGARKWERENLYFPGVGWAGHCNGFAAASIIEPEPNRDYQMHGVKFTPGDVKGLLSAYHIADAQLWALGDAKYLSPAQFHNALLTWMGEQGMSFVVTFVIDGNQAWNMPLLAYETTMTQITEEQWSVSTRIWMADYNVPANSIGTVAYPNSSGLEFRYTLFGDPRQPYDGEWKSVSNGGRLGNHYPQQIWYPDPLRRYSSVNNIGLDKKILDEIVLNTSG